MSALAQLPTRRCGNCFFMAVMPELIAACDERAEQLLAEADAFALAAEVTRVALWRERVLEARLQAGVWAMRAAVARDWLAAHPPT